MNYPPTKNHWVFSLKIDKDIAKAQLMGSNLTSTPLSDTDSRLLNPDISVIKKQISRWFDGSRLSIDHVKKYFLILNQHYDPKEIDFYLFVIELINIFTYI